MINFYIYISISLYFCINCFLAGREYHYKITKEVIFFFLFGSFIPLTFIIITPLAAMYGLFLRLFGDTKPILLIRLNLFKEFDGLKKWQIDNAIKDYNNSKSEKDKWILSKIIERNKGKYDSPKDFLKLKDSNAST